MGQIICLEKEVVVLEKNQLVLSPSLSCFFSWGFPDNSCAFGNYATGKVCMQEYKVIAVLTSIYCNAQSGIFMPTKLEEIHQNVPCVDLKKWVISYLVY